MNRINSIVYAVDGGMEDWMYAAGWDKGLVRQDCTGNSDSPIRSLPRYLRSDNDSLSFVDNRQVSANISGPALELSGNRALVFLVETSDAKAPSESTLGGSEEVSFFYLRMNIIVSYFVYSCAGSLSEWERKWSYS